MDRLGKSFASPASGKRALSFSTQAAEVLDKQRQPCLTVVAPKSTFD
jgi:hypothetical protein